MKKFGLEYIGGAGTVEKAITGTPIAQKLIDKINGETAVKVGEDFGKLGTYIGNEHPKLSVNWSALQKGSHALDRMLERGVTKADVEYFIKYGKVLKQTRGKYAFVSEKGVAVLNEKGTLITTYSSRDYDKLMKEIVNKLFRK